MKRLTNLLALPPADARLLLTAVAALLTARLLLRLWSIDRLRVWSGRLGSKPRQPPEDIVWAVQTATRRLPGTSCLASALALQRLLARHGHSSEIHIGVAKERRALAAHAWVVCDGRVLMDTEDHGAYTRLVAWPASDTTTLVRRDL
ncbi:MAG: lasso peptide biosynthesis B2 protein [Enhydrobacter sp.]|nr:MAG: lasso peptide biosynthesis B2 protein [Enhydrobacter sp.]